MGRWIKFSVHGDPEIEVVVGHSASELTARMKANLPPPAKVETMPTAALLDTGAMRSFIPMKVVRDLGLVARGVAYIHTPIAGRVRMPIYTVSLKIMERGTNGNWRETALAGPLAVGVIPDPRPGDSMRYPKPIVGLDVLSACRFTFDGPDKRLEFLHHQKRQRGFVATCTSMFRRSGSN